MPKQPTDDRLLTITRLILTLMLGLTIILGTVLLLVIPILFARQRDVAADLVANGMDPAAIPWIALLLLIGAGIAALGFFFFRHLRRIVDSVSQGDPFVPVNADRLRAMGWLTVAIQFMLVILAGIGMAFDGIRPALMAEDALNAAFGGFLLALVLFILARVFRLGAAMREELEGTI